MSRRHAVVVIDRPADWSLQSPQDFPTPFVVADGVPLGAAAEIARQLNERELAEPQGRWAIAAKVLTPVKRRRTDGEPQVYLIEVTHGNDPPTLLDAQPRIKVGAEAACTAYNRIAVLIGTGSVARPVACPVVLPARYARGAKGGAA